jgi:hypothetical protein
MVVAALRSWGCQVWRCVSTVPGAMMPPPASITSASVTPRSRPTAAIVSPSMSSSPSAVTPRAGSPVTM